MRPESRWNGVVALLTALPTSPAKNLILFYTWWFFWQNPVPACQLHFWSQPSHERAPLPSRSDSFHTDYTRSRLCPHAHQGWKIFFFSFSESKIKLEVHKSYKSAAGNKVTRFTAYDPNTCCAKLAFSHLNCHKMCLGWHFIFTICPYCKIKAVVPFFLGISLGLNSFLNACLCLIIILRHCFKSSFSLSNLSLPDSKAALELSVLRWLINWLTDYPDISINTASPATLTCACWWGKVGRHTNWRNCLNKEHY